MRSLRVALWPWAVGLLFQLAVGAMGMGAAPSAGQPLPPPPAAAKPAEPKPPPPKGSHVPADKNNCIACHGESDLWEKETRHLYISKDALKNNVHWNAGVNCHDCHGGNYQAEEQNAAHRIEDGFRSKLPDMRKQCAVCHKEEALSLRKSVHEHANAGAKNQAGQSPPLDCDQCHGKLAHELLPVHDSNSPVFLDHQIKTCGGCHEEHLATYLKSVHGQGLEKLGLMVVPACADCHGAHGVYRAIDLRSTLNVAHVADTCGKCHRYIKERLEASIHGGPTGPGGLAKRNAPGGKSQQKPSCTSCHQKHDILDVRVRAVPPGDAPSLRQLPHRPFQPLRDEHSRPAVRVGLWPRREVLRLPRRGTRSRRSPIRGRWSRRRIGRRRAANAIRTRRPISSTSIRTPTTPTHGAARWSTAFTSCS